MITDEFLSKIAEALEKNNVTLSTLIGDEDEQEIVRLARVGLWVKHNCIVSDMRKVAQLGGYFDEALNQLAEESPSQITRELTPEESQKHGKAFPDCEQGMTLYCTKCKTDFNPQPAAELGDICPTCGLDILWLKDECPSQPFKDKTK